MKRELANFVQSVAHAFPLVLFLDDLHWPISPTTDLLSFLAGKFDVVRVLIVVTYRPSYVAGEASIRADQAGLQARGVCRNCC